MLPEEELLSGVRWKVIETLAKEGPLTAARIAQESNTSLPAISQATKLLEAYDYIKATSMRRGTPGKPRLEYSLKKELAIVTLCSRQAASRYSISPSPMHIATLRILGLKPGERDWLLQFLWSHREILESADAIVYVRSEKEETHLAIITPNVDRYRKEYSHVTLTAGTQTRKIVSWSHTKEEVDEGLENGERYFKELFEKPTILYDPKGVLDG